MVLCLISKQTMFFQPLCLAHTEIFLSSCPSTQLYAFLKSNEVLLPLKALPATVCHSGMSLNFGLREIKLNILFHLLACDLGKFTNLFEV